MGETVAYTYATNNSNTAGSSGNPVAVVNDGTGDRQIVGLGYLDGSTNLIGIPGSPLYVYATLATLAVGNFPATQVISGSVTIYGEPANIATVYQGGAPWTVNASIQGSIPVTGTFYQPNQPVTASIAGTPSVLIASTVTVNQGTNPWLVNASIVGTVPVSGFPVTQNVIATIANASIPVTESGAWNVTATISNTINALATVTQGTTPWLVNASIQGNIPVMVTVGTISVGLDNVLATVSQGTSPWLVNASVVGQQAVTASIAGVPNVIATVSPIGIYNSIAPSLVSLQTQQVQLDQHANLLTNIATVSAPIPITAAESGSWNVTATVGNIVSVAESGAWGVTATVGNTVNVAESGAWNVTATIGNTVNVVAASTVTVAQGTNPWLVQATIGVPTVNQGTSPWIVDATVYGQLSVTASVIGTPTVQVSTIVTLAIGSMPAISVTATNTTVWQGGAPWLVNASVVGQQNVTASISGTAPVSQSGAPWTVNASLYGNIPQVLASTSNSQLFTAFVGLGQYTPTVQSIASSATLAYYPHALDINGNQKVILQSVATVVQGTSPWVVDTTIFGPLNVIPTVVTVLQGTSPWVVSATTFGLLSVNATYAAPWGVVASQYSNLVQVMASVANPTVLDASVELAQYAQGAMISIASAATYAYYPNLTDVNAQDLMTPGASASSIGAAIYNNISLVATCVTIKSSGGVANLYGYHFYNSGSSVTYISLFAQTLATMGKTSATAILAVPAGGWADTSPGTPINFSSGLLMGASASINGTGNPTPILANVWYK